MIEPIFPPVIMNIAITRVYRVMAVWMPVTVVPTSLATVAMDTFMTELSRVIRNCPAARVSRTSPVPLAAASGARLLTASASIPSHTTSAQPTPWSSPGRTLHTSAVPLASSRRDNSCRWAALGLHRGRELDHRVS